MTNQTIEQKPAEATRDVITTQRFRSNQLPSPDDAPTKATHAKELLQMVSMSVPVIGFVGTVFVWCAANLYVGDVEIVTDRACPDMMVRVYNQKGHESTYRINKFQLMPGEYRVEVLPDGKSKTVSDINVKFHTLNRILVTAPKGMISGIKGAPSAVPGIETPGPAGADPGTQAKSPSQVTDGAVDGQPRRGEQQDSSLQTTEPVTAATPQTKSAEGTAAIQDAETQKIKQAEANAAPAEADTSAVTNKKKWWPHFHKKAAN